MIGPLSRRRALQLTGATTLAALAGCTTSVFNSVQEQQEYSLTVDLIEQSPVEDALYTPSDKVLFGDPADAALSDILPTGRHTTYGYEPIPEDAYVEYEGSYYQTKSIITGRKQVQRTLIHVDQVDRENVPEDAIHIDSLNQPSARVLKILHSHTQSNGKATTELLRDDAYVLRLPAEQESALGTDELGGQVVKMSDSGSWAYSVEVTRERITETAHTMLAVKVADSREQFREIVFGSRIDTDLTSENIPANAQQILEDAIVQSVYRETTPLSEGFETLLDILDLETVEEGVNGRLLWYNDEYYRFGLYINEQS